MINKIKIFMSGPICRCDSDFSVNFDQGYVIVQCKECRARIEAPADDIDFKVSY